MVRSSKVLLLALLGAALAVEGCGDASAGPEGDVPTNVVGNSDPTSPTDGQADAATGNVSPSQPDAGSPQQPQSPTQPIRFVAMGDTGTGANDQFKVGNAVASVCKTRGCDFVQLLGDNIYESGASSVDDPIFQTHFEIPYAAIDLDFWVVLGNHDYGHAGAGTDFPKGQHEIDYTAKSKKWKLPSAYWHKSFTSSSASVEIFGLDTNKAMFGLDAQQRVDVSAWLAASTAEWKIAMGHHPYKSNGPHGNAGSYDAILGVSVPPVNGRGVKEYLEEAICGNVDLYLSGHDHSRQWLNESCMGTELAVSGAGAKATKLDGKNPTLFESLELGFLYIVIDGKKLTAEFIDENGTTEFSHTMVKP
ncbi:MAG TPA: metallophosphoesterase [Labilithrix sp.]|nr:metallophosphoesterase [Labilithrix sp.]